MNPDLKQFAQQVGGVALMALGAVMLTAFLAIPYELGYTPGEAAEQSVVLANAAAPTQQT